MKTSYNVVNAIICCAKEGRGLIIGNPGSPLVSTLGFHDMVKYREHMGRGLGLEIC